MRIAKWVMIAVASGWIAVLYAGDRQFAIVPIGAFDEARRAILRPAWRVKPDSSQVLFDKHGNVPFTVEEDSTLRTFFDVEFVDEDSIQGYLERNGWSSSDGEERW